MSWKKSISDTDRGLDKIIRNLKDLDRSVVKVGLFSDDESADDSMTMANLGLIQERGANLGVGVIPDRPFMENTAIEHEDQIGNVMVAEVDKLMSGRITSKDVIESIGDEYSDMTKQTINDFDTPANREYTIELKGFNNPLIHTGKMKESVKFKVVRKR